MGFVERLLRMGDAQATLCYKALKSKEKAFC